MNRKLGSCSIKLPDIGSVCNDGEAVCDDGSSEPELSFKKRQQLINFGHTQWGKNNWSWSVTKQDLDFADYSNGKFTAGVAAYVTISVNTIGIHRADVGYGTSLAVQKGSAIHRARKSAVTNALRETLFSFGGSIAMCLYELLEVNNSKEQAMPKHESEDMKTDFVTSKQNVQLEEAKNSSAISTPLTSAQLQRSDTFQKETKPLGNSRQQQTFTNGQYPVKTLPVQPPLNHFPQPLPEKPVYPANQTALPTNKTALPANKQAVGGPPANQVPVKIQPIAVHPPVVPSAPIPPAPIPQPPTSSMTSHLRSNSNVEDVVSNTVSDQEIRAERKRRQRQCQEEFRLKRLQKLNPS